MNRTKQNKRLFAMVTCALLIAIQIVLSRFFSISTPIVKIGFGFAPMAFAGMLFGPFYSCAVGVLSDFLGANLFPIGVYFPGFTLVSGLSGITYGLLLHRPEGVHWGRISVAIRIIVAVLIVTLPLQLGLDTLWLSILFDKGYWAYIPARIVKTLVMIPVQFITITLLYQLESVPSFRLAK